MKRTEHKMISLLDAFAYNEAWQHPRCWDKMIYAMLNTDYAVRARRERSLNTVTTNL